MSKSIPQAKIEKLSDRDHILRRPSMYIGGVSKEQVEDYVLVDNRLVQTALEYAPGLVKIINEVIDNSVDAIIKTGVGDRVSVEISQDSITVADNSTGFPLKPDAADEPQEEPLVLALGNARAGSNFNDDQNQGQMGTNGVGAFATNCFSKHFKAISCTASGSKFKTVTAEWRQAELIEVSDKTTKTGKTGTAVSFSPDLAKFQETEITNDIKSAIATRLNCLAYTYPNIQFVFQNEPIKAPKSIIEWFPNKTAGDAEIAEIEDPSVSFKTDLYEIHVVARAATIPNFSFVNGLNIRDGGSHVDVICGDISRGFGNVRGLNANKSDITNTLQIITVAKGFKNLRFNSQTKEKITNSAAEIREYFGDLQPLVTKVCKSAKIKDFIKATQAAREHRANKAKMNAVKNKKIKSEKFLDAQQTRTNLILVEGDSALGGLVPALGRKDIAYYALKGKPLNAYSATHLKLVNNKELSDLLNIIHNSDFERIIVGTDQDLDGFHIRGLLLGFFVKYLPELLDRIYFLQTPVRGVTANGVLKRWSFNLQEDLKIKNSERSQYYKGLGSWDREDLQIVIKQEGFESLLSKVQIDLENKEHLRVLEGWLGDDSDIRKTMILANNFNIARI